MKELFVPYEPSLALRELGFDEICFGEYYYGKLKYDEISNGQTVHTDLVSAPTYQQAFRWFRKKYNLFGCIDLHVCNPTHWYIRIDDIIKNDYIYHSEDNNLSFDTPEEAELACINKLIEIAKKIKQ
jgi:hypothetical protein